jgi:hypothetical protein
MEVVHCDRLGTLAKPSWSYSNRNVLDSVLVDFPIFLAYFFLSLKKNGKAVGQIRRCLGTPYMRVTLPLETYVGLESESHLDFGLRTT